jgi:hypothetical protein
VHSLVEIDIGLGIKTSWVAESVLIQQLLVLHYCTKVLNGHGLVFFSNQPLTSFFLSF